MTRVRPVACGRAALLAALLAVVTTFMGTRAEAMKIQVVKSPGGITAWLVEEHSVPLIGMRFAFEGGSAQDPAGKEGVAHFLAGMLDEGAGDLPAKVFQERMEEIAMRMSYDDARDAFYGSFETLSENREQAVALLSLALGKPRFDADAVDRVRGQLLAGLAYAARDPDRVATEQWNAAAFAGHPYGRPANGTPATIQGMTRDDLREYWSRVFAKDNLRVVVVGDIDAATLGGMLDTLFGQLPDKARLTPVPPVQPAAAEKLRVIEMAVPQSVARFGLPAFPRSDKDFIPAFVVNTVLGGGVMSSRLWEEVREKRGLAYSVHTQIQPYKQTAVFSGGVATKNEEIANSMEVIKGELKRIAADGPTEKELRDAKDYLTGSFALRFDSNAKIANQLLWFWQEGLDPGYVDRRNAEIEAVTLEDARRAAKRLFEGQEPIVTIVGKPKGLAATPQPRG
ncbi:MAG TPA: pitrilysin family protein [Hyphomicrobiaceae bacterium]|jgi:zinc protease|nr:pitrilysin family protein [Hyphomicrobiaceae bacterium]